MKALVSVIIPIYDVEKYLPACLDSVINQTLNDIEIICVNDGSPDNCDEILERYAQKDSRIKVIVQENGGLSVARNTGFAAATGKYIAFVDSDDCLKPGALEMLYSTAEDNQLDHIIFASEVFYDGYRPETDEWTSYYAHSRTYGTIKSGPECFADLVLNNDYVYAAQLRFSLRSRLVQQKILFRPGMIHEDTLYSFMNDLSAKRAMIMDEKPYLFRKRADSITTGSLSIKHMIGYFVSFIECLRFVSSKKYSPNVLKAIDRDLNRKYRAACRDYQKIKDHSTTADMWLDCPMAKALIPVLVEKPLPNAVKIERFTDVVRKSVISIIVPVFNVQDYLVDCLESLRRQTIKDIEIICIDDGSTDESKTILHFYSLLDTRIKILETTNLGAGAARNWGLKFAFGKYLAFFDSDDWGDINLLKKLVDAAERESSDVVVCRSYRYSQREQEIVRETRLPPNMLKKQGPYTYRDAGDRIFIDFGNQPWAKLFRRRFIEENNIRFQEIARANDLRFVWQAVIMAGKLSIVDEALYYYRIDIPNSLQSTNEQSPTLFLEAWKSLVEKTKDTDHFEDMEISLANAVWSGCLFTFDRIKTREGCDLLFNTLKESAIKEFHIDDLTEKTCLNKIHYERLKKFRVAKSFEEFIAPK